MQYSYRQIIIHIIGCILFLSIPIVFSPDLASKAMLFTFPPFQRNFMCYVLLLFFFYLNYFYLIPKFYFTKKRVIFFVIILLCYFFVAYFPSTIIPMDFANMPPRQTMGMQGQMPPRSFIRPMEGDSIIQFLLIFALSFLLKINNQLTDIQSEKLKAEVSYLKAQINPHFLFNTLNSLYSLTISKSDDAPDAVLKLSNMMRYVVTESTNDFVSLEKELNYIKDYIDLQRLRIADENYLNISISGSAEGKKIAPLVIIPFIENAFKYGINSEEDWRISIKITIVENVFLMDVENNIVNVNLPENSISEQGIENTERRLEFIYPGSHELKIIETKEIFKVILKINLV